MCPQQRYSFVGVASIQIRNGCMGGQSGRLMKTAAVPSSGMWIPMACNPPLQRMLAYKDVSYMVANIVSARSLSKEPSFLKKPVVSFKWLAAQEHNRITQPKTPSAMVLMLQTVMCPVFLGHGYINPPLNVQREHLQDVAQFPLVLFHGALGQEFVKLCWRFVFLLPVYMLFCP